MNLLTDQQMARFLIDGYVVLRPAELSGACHERAFGGVANLRDESRRLGGETLHLERYGDDLPARLPDLARLPERTTVVGALTGVLGQG